MELKDLLTDEKELLEVGGALRSLKAHPGYAALMELLKRGKDDAYRAGFRDRDHLDKYAAQVEVYEDLPKMVDAIIEAEVQARESVVATGKELGNMRAGSGSPVLGE